MARLDFRRSIPPWSLLAVLLAAAPGPVDGASSGGATSDLAAHVRAGHWGEVRVACAAHPRPWPAEVVLVAARAERLLGDLGRAQEILHAGLPQAGTLAAALRLEAAEAALATRRDPWPFVQPLLVARADRAHQRAVGHVLRRAWDTLPENILDAYQSRPLPRTLRRWRDAATSTRTGNVSLALKLLEDRHDDGPAGRAASFLASRRELPPEARLLVGQGLLATGFWREAEAWLSQLPQPDGAGQRQTLAFFHGRALYRLGRTAEAASRFQVALDTATTAMERHAAAVQLARCEELSGDWDAAGVAWETARRADPTAPAGWEGVARAAVMRGSTEGLCAPLANAPPAAQIVAAERIAAVLLARSQGEAAHACLAYAAPGSARARLLNALQRRGAGHYDEARRQFSAVIADVKAGTWREVVLLLQPPYPPSSSLEPEPTRTLPQLAELASRYGPGQARAALAAALAADPAWAFVLGDPPPVPASLPRELHAFWRVGLEREAARLHAATFPVSVPAEAAWSARVLATWDNSPAALGAGERVWQALAGVPAGLLPAIVARAVLPEEMVRPLATAAAAAGVSPALLAAIVRQESRFDADAFSPAGARGMGQLVPETARRLGASEEDLWHPDLSLALSAKELARLQQVFGARPAVVAAAYNAGETVVASWLAVLGGRCDEAIFAAAIPYQETSTYVRAVLEGMSLARYLEE